jgi:hypothetical protein
VAKAKRIIIRGNGHENDWKQKRASFGTAAIRLIAVVLVLVIALSGPFHGAATMRGNAIAEFACDGQVRRSNVSPAG